MNPPNEPNVFNRTTTLDRGLFVVSLDFELAWGTRGRPSAGKVDAYLDLSLIHI